MAHRVSTSPTEADRPTRQAHPRAVAVSDCRSQRCEPMRIGVGSPRATRVSPLGQPISPLDSPVRTERDSVPRLPHVRHDAGDSVPQAACTYHTTMGGFRRWGELAWRARHQRVPPCTKTALRTAVFPGLRRLTNTAAVGRSENKGVARWVCYSGCRCIRGWYEARPSGRRCVDGRSPPGCAGTPVPS
jgi:hypothetical protein